VFARQNLFFIFSQEASENCMDELLRHQIQQEHQQQNISG
jgi:hypothetical protein